MRPMAMGFGPDEDVMAELDPLETNSVFHAQRPRLLQQHGRSWVVFAGPLKGAFKDLTTLVTCAPRRRFRLGTKSERALLRLFREMYGELLTCNSHGKQMIWTDELEYFAPAELKSVSKKA